MKTPILHTSTRSRAFTLIELLVVIAIIGILAAMLLPVLGKVKTQAKVNVAKLEMQQLAQAITSYHSTYGRYPASSAAMLQATQKKEDFTYYDGSAINSVVVFDAPNSEVMAILMDETNTFIGNPFTGAAWPNPNVNHQKNPRQIKFITPKKSNWNPSMGQPPLSGVDTNLVYRDPFGKPYVISMDLNYDEKCRDAVYKLPGVSQQSGANGYNGLFQSQNDINDNPVFEFSGGVMVWSFGPDGAYLPTDKANAGLNKDNILIWK